jgi:hypothetical protein
MRVVCLLLVLVSTISCSGPKKSKAESVKKYCVLTTMPRQTEGELHALYDKAVALFAERKPYKVTDVNRRVIDAATALASNALLAYRQAQQPHLFPGQPKGLNLETSVNELSAACNVLATTEKGNK